MKLINGDCIEALKDVPDKSVDLIVMDPPYELETHGCGAFGNANREYHAELNPISKGITNETLDLIYSKMKKINIYIYGVIKRSFANILITSMTANVTWTY